MIDTYSGLKYDEFVVIRNDEYEGVFNKLQMFDLYRDGQNIYFDLDVIIKSPDIVDSAVSVKMSMYLFVYKTKRDVKITAKCPLYTLS